MFKLLITRGAKAVSIAALLAMFAAVASAQQTTGSVTMSAAVSNYVELNSGGAVTLSGSSGGSVTTDGTLDSPLAVVVNMGELGPSNSNSFVKLSVPLKLRSNVSYQLKMSGSLSGAGAAASSLKVTDVGFGMDPSARPASLSSGTDTNATPGDPTVGGSTDANGRWLFAGSNSTLGDFSSAATVLSGPRINKTVPKANTSGLVVPAIFAIKPQFYDPAASITISANFTISAP
jgi:hypothetical protein